MLTPNPNGNYGFLPGIDPYSSGVIADAGYEVVHVRLASPVEWRTGFDLVESHLAANDRPRSALCGIQLRCPRPHTMDGFVAFNSDYVALLDSWGLILNGKNPVARTNVAPVREPPSETHLYAFSFTRRSEREGRTFVVAGAGELRSRALDSGGILRRGETDSGAMREKAAYVMNVMSKRLEGLGVGWDLVTCMNVYTVHPVDDLLEKALVPVARTAVSRGVTLHFTRPPIVEIEFEMDVRGVRWEAVAG